MPSIVIPPAPAQEWETRSETTVIPARDEMFHDPDMERIAAVIYNDTFAIAFENATVLRYGFPATYAAAAAKEADELYRAQCEKITHRVDERVILHDVAIPLHGPTFVATGEAEKPVTEAEKQHRAAITDDVNDRTRYKSTQDVVREQKEAYRRNRPPSPYRTPSDGLTAGGGRIWRPVTEFSR